MGLDAPNPGRGVFQMMFSLADHLAGSPFSSLTPWPPGPRNWSQSAAAVMELMERRTPQTTQQSSLMVYLQRCRSNSPNYSSEQLVCFVRNVALGRSGFGGIGQQLSVGLWILKHLEHRFAIHILVDGDVEQEAGRREGVFGVDDYLFLHRQINIFLNS